MSYEGQMLLDLEMPHRKDVEIALLKALFNNNGVIKEFNSDEKVVNELALQFDLNEKQKEAKLERIYKKENRIVKSPLWHRLLFRAAHNLSQKGYITNPSITSNLTGKKEWMLTEKGYDKTLQILSIDTNEKDELNVISFEVQNIVNGLKTQERPQIYNPFDETKKITKISKETKLRNRGFRLAVVEAYNYRCAICGLKIFSPDNKQWEVEAAHIVPHNKNGKDDILNGIALCKFHHWAFDVGWFSLLNNFDIILSNNIVEVPSDMGKMYNYNLINTSIKNNKIFLPQNSNLYPHPNSLEWHRNNIFYK